MMPRYECVRLVDFNDRQYQRLRARFTSFRKRKGIGPSSRDLFSKDAERTLRRWLEGNIHLTMLRIIRYRERIGVGTIEKYRELDGVGLDGSRLLLFEIKTTRSKEAVQAGLEQLATAREILGHGFPAIRTCLLVVDTDDAPNSPVATFLSRSPVVRFIGSLDELSDDPRPHVMLFSVADIETLSQVPVHLEWRDAA